MALRFSKCAGGFLQRTMDLLTRKDEVLDLCTKASEKKHSQDVQVQDVPKPSAIAQVVQICLSTPFPLTTARYLFTTQNLVCPYKNKPLTHPWSACPSVFLYFFPLHTSQID